MLKMETSKKISEVVIDALFSDNIYNVWINIREMIRYNNKLDKNDHRIYAVLGDGECQEGQVWEATMSAAHYKLDNLCIIVDNNNLQIDGHVDEVMSVYPLDKKFEAFNCHVINVDGHDFDQLRAALKEARETKGMPTVIVAKTIKGKGVSFMEDQQGWHGVAPNEEQYHAAMKELEAE